MKLISYFVLLVFLQIHQMVQAQSNIDGKWLGAIQIQGIDLKILVTFKTDDTLKASIDIPQQGAKNIDLLNVLYQEPRIYFELIGSAGVAKFDGKVIETNKIEGDFTQGNFIGKFNLQKDDGTIVSENKTPKPYKEEEVSFENDGYNFGATLTLPISEGRHPALVLITGSGTQNRDEEILGFKLFEIIADSLTRRGIAVLRYDDRGFGKPDQRLMNATTQDFAGDALAAFKYLRTRKDINPDQIGLLGHSEGGIIASILASQNPEIAYIILMASTGASGEEVILEQSVLINRASGMPEKDVQYSANFSRKAFNVVKTDQGWEELRKDFWDLFAKENVQPKDTSKENKEARELYINQEIDKQFNQMKMPWFKYFLKFDPVTALEKVKCPVLALFGGLDLQVPVSQNREPILSALKKAGNADVEDKTFPKANHLFQDANTGNPSEYGSLKKEFVNEFTDTISNWLLKRVTIVK